jgi:hypothetical protein
VRLSALCLLLGSKEDGARGTRSAGSIFPSKVLRSQRQTNPSQIPQHATESKFPMRYKSSKVGLAFPLEHPEHRAHDMAWAAWLTLKAGAFRARLCAQHLDTSPSFRRLTSRSRPPKSPSIEEPPVLFSDDRPTSDAPPNSTPHLTLATHQKHSHHAAYAQ